MENNTRGETTRGGDEEKLRKLLDKWSEGCSLCQAWGEDEEDYRAHSFERCKEEFSEARRKKFSRMKKVTVWEKYSGCYDCHIPQRICNGWKARPGATWGYMRCGQDCQYAGVLEKAVISIWSEERQEEFFAVAEGKGF